MGSVARAGDSTAARVPNVLAKILLLVARVVVVIVLNVTQHAPAVAAWRPWPHLYLNTTSATVGGLGFGARATDSDLDLGASKKFEGSSEFVQLRYHMGPVLTANITVHPIWYGRQWSRAQKRIIRSFLRSISPSSSGVPPRRPSVAAWWRTVRLYTDQTGANISAAVALGAEKSDRRLSRGASLSRLDIQGVIRDAVTAKTRPLPVNARGGLYLVLTSPDVAVEDFCGQVCGFHYFTFPSIVGYALPYAWAGNSAGRCPEVCAYPFAVPSYVPGARAERAPNGDVGVDGMVSVVAHELAEMASNPLVNAWYAGADPCFPTEIADLCEGIYGTGGGGAYTGQLLLDRRTGAAYNANGVGGRRFLVQWIWNPILNYCSGPNALDQ
ncbi:protein EXORDIUM-like 3 [Ananas comosus]|uniref:Protein EXORDIUM-like 3 n=1 Tax=Ananas comosus TaxID=4615 RepID=A0A6P5HRB0_ANACO|nr:protein EXORDIUM-like 3 [Ananas comosus]